MLSQNLQIDDELALESFSCEMYKFILKNWQPRFL
jgi:hypothetical protein